MFEVYCAACLTRQHQDCEGWVDGFCGCTGGLCLLRLLTGVLWDLHDP